MLNQRKTKAKSKRTVLAAVRETCLTENHLQLKTTSCLSMTQAINSLLQVAQFAAGTQLSRPLVSCSQAAGAAIKQLQNKRQAWPSPAIDPQLHSVESSIQQICFPLIKLKKMGGVGCKRVIKRRHVFIWQSAGTEWQPLGYIIGPNNSKLSVMQSDVWGHSGLLQIELCLQHTNFDRYSLSGGPRWWMPVLTPKAPNEFWEPLTMRARTQHVIAGNEKRTVALWGGRAITSETGWKNSGFNLGGRVSHWQSGPCATQRLGWRSINHDIKPASPGYPALAVIVLCDLKYSRREGEG